MNEKVNEWLHFAKIDLISAQGLLKIDEMCAGVAAYHAQQATEKSFKSYMLFRKQVVIKTHDLQLLLERCMVFDAEFFQLRNHAKALNPFSIQTRYPDDQSIGLSQQEAEELVALAIECFDFVTQKIKKI